MYKIINSKYIWCPINGILKDHSILIKSNKIHRIDQYKNLNILKYKKINLKNSILIPGLVNSHIHLELNWVKKVKVFIRIYRLVEPNNRFKNRIE